ncbi:MAG: hypothetical protein GW801_15680 [Sphingomonadales bacterium]|nr:hypothetical protein [Sphingomonadales bacterium]
MSPQGFHPAWRSTHVEAAPIGLAERLAAVEGIGQVALVPLKKRGNLRLVA